VPKPRSVPRKRAPSKTRQQRVVARRRLRTVVARWVGVLYTASDDFAEAAEDRAAARAVDQALRLDELERLRAQHERAAARAVDQALRLFRVRVGGQARALAALLVEVHGPRIRLPLHPLRRGSQEIRALFRRRPRDPHLSLADAVALVQRHGPERAAVALARRHGLRVFDRLNQFARASGEVRALLTLEPPLRRGRPAGHTGRDRVAFALVDYAVAELVDGLSIARGRLLRALGRPAKSAVGDVTAVRSELPDWKWLRRCLERGRLLRTQAESDSPHLGSSAGAAVIVFLCSYIRDSPPPLRVSLLSPYLVAAIPPGRRRAILRQHLGTIPPERRDQFAERTRHILAAGGSRLAGLMVDLINDVLSEALAARLVKLLPPLTP